MLLNTVSFLLNLIFFLKSLLLSNKSNSIVSTKDKLKSRFDSKINFKVFIKWLYCLLCLNIIFLTIFSYQNVLFYNHSYLNNFLVSITYLIFIINLGVLTIILNIKKFNITNINSFFFSISNLIVFFLLPFTANNIFYFLLLTEFVSALILLKLISSRSLNSIKNKNNNFKIFSSNMIDMFFYQYWILFFSSIFLMFFLINMSYQFNTIDWNLLDYLTYSNKNLSINNVYVQCFYIIIFLMGFLLKLGITPFHFFKLNIYNGLPIVSVFFYTIYYFIIFFFLFVYVLINKIPITINIYWFFLFIVLLIGCIYLMFVIFEFNFLKTFFAYSSIINSYFFLLTIFLVI